MSVGIARHSQATVSTQGLTGSWRALCVRGLELQRTSYTVHRRHSGPHTCPPLLDMIANLGPILVLALAATVLAGDINRQSIIFNEKTPDVFYCPQVSQSHLVLQTMYHKIAGETDLH